MHSRLGRDVFARKVVGGLTGQLQARCFGGWRQATREAAIARGWEAERSQLEQGRERERGKAVDAASELSVAREKLDELQRRCGELGEQKRCAGEGCGVPVLVCTRCLSNKVPAESLLCPLCAG